MAKSLRQIIDEYISQGIIEGNTAKTVENKRNLFNRLFVWLNGREFTLDTAIEYSSYLLQKGCTQNTLKTEVTNIRAFVNYMAERDYIKKNWSKQLKKPKQITRSDFEFIKPEIVHEIINAGTEPTPYVRRGELGDNALNKKRKYEARLALRFMLDHGLRIQEVLTLKGSDIKIYADPPQFLVPPSKGHKAEPMPLLRTWVKELEPRINLLRLFPTTRETCNIALQRGAKKMGINVKITNHYLRHIFASNLARNKAPVQFTKRLMRHSSIEITDTYYTHLDMPDLSLVMHTAQPISRSALSFNDKIAFIEQQIRNLGFEKDPAVEWEIKKEGDSFSFIMKSKAQKKI